jgi:hypothetical protein
MSQDNSFNRKNIEALGESVTVADSDGIGINRIDMFCYVKCSDSDCPLLKQCRGVVFNGDRCILRSFPYPTEYNLSIETDNEKIHSLISEDDFKTWSFYEAHEGALIRMFFFDGKWYVSTCRKLDAFRSKWSSSDSFGVMLEKALLAELGHNILLSELFHQRSDKSDMSALNVFKSSLDVNKQYMFLVRNNDDNRIVCNAPIEPTVYHVGTFEHDKLDLDKKCLISQPKKLEITNHVQLADYIKGCDYTQIQGIICFGPNEIQLKVITPEYQRLFKVRGNEPSIKFRYLQLRTDPDMVRELCHLYPKCDVFIKEYEKNISTICAGIYKAYVDRFIRKQFVVVSKEEYYVVKQCHAWYMSDRENRRVTLPIVLNFLNQQPAVCLNRMIKNYKTRIAIQPPTTDETKLVYIRALQGLNNLTISQ